MTDIPQPIWQQKLGKFTLREYPEAPNFLNCSIRYLDDDDDNDEGETSIGFGFIRWGMDREEITEEMCFLCCQALLDQNANVSVTSFKRNLEYAQDYFSELEDDEIYE
jgi:hypothetical protein